LEPHRPSTNPFFVAYYHHPKRLAFENQVAFLVDSLDQHHRIRTSAHRDEVLVQDYSPYAHMAVYARAQRELGYLTESQSCLLDRLASAVEPLLIPPALLVYRRMSLTKAMERIRDRGRPGESRARPAFVSAVVRQFERWVRAWDRSPVIELPPELDIAGDPSALARVAGLILNTLR
jgi:deoxyadenosine/deoxycytidine kinase